MEQVHDTILLVIMQRILNTNSGDVALLLLHLIIPQVYSTVNRHVTMMKNQWKVLLQI